MTGNHERPDEKLLGTLEDQGGGHTPHEAQRRAQRRPDGLDGELAAALLVGFLAAWIWLSANVVGWPVGMALGILVVLGVVVWWHRRRRPAA